ncbi:MAG: tetratricopeptide repeat protein [Anaerolineae bacterium]
MYRRLAFVTVFVLLLLVVVPTFAQDAPALTEKFTTYDSLLTVNYPQGWFVDSEADDFGTGFFMLANSADALETMRRNSKAEQIKAVGKGEVGIIVMRPAYLRKVFDYNTLTTPKQALEGMFGKLDGFNANDIVELTLGDYPAARYDAADKRSAGLILAVDAGDGGIYVLVASSRPDEMAQFESTVLDVAQSLHFGGDAAHLLIHDATLWDVRWSPDSTIVATRTSNIQAKENIVRLWDAVTGDMTAEFKNGLGVNWKPDLSQFVIWDVNSFTRVYDAVTQESLFTLPGATYANWKADGSQMITSTFGDSLVQVYEPEHGRRQLSIEAQTSLPAWKRDGAVIETRKISTGSGTNSIQLWDAATGENVLTVENSKYAVWNSDQSQIMAITDDKVIHVFDATNGSEVLTLSVETEAERDGVYDAEWHTGESLIAANVGRCSATRDNCSLSLWVWDAQSGDVVGRLGEEEPFSAAVWQPDGSRVLTLSREPSHALLWDVASGKVVATFEHPDTVRGAAWKADGSQLMTWSDENIVRIWDSETGEMVLALPHEVAIQRAEWNADETLIETEAEDGGLYFWDTETGRMLLRIGHASKGEKDVYVWQDWSPDGHYLVTRLSNSLLARVWDVPAQTAAAREAFEASAFTAEELNKQATDTLNNRDFAGAVAIYGQALRLDPDNAEIYNGRAVAQYRLDRIQLALEDMTRAIQLKPDYFQAYINRGDMYRLQGDPDRAMEDYNRALEVKEDAAAYNRRGIIYSNQKQYDEAIAEYSRAIELNPELAIAYSNRGYAYYAKGKEFYDEALADFQQYAKLAGDKANPDVLDLIKKLAG